ncbi:hypothetical protein HYH03_010951 [Edaphochlamys debaryana]|uniref:Pherophorin domain-containing protein n=1 Tax=Edaphochlamys debaryana TaxID=47281 RepID=A0A836BW13_9CHLO|nr:hypothetical protein HYH03_010951 [Edaphochlamys debaryana]|eukprot:KAG2490557.1 hypothetical protein HYH03_010951 [Edaphochlamys debaryana]
MRLAKASGLLLAILVIALRHAAAAKPGSSPPARACSSATLFTSDLAGIQTPVSYLSGPIATGAVGRVVGSAAVFPGPGALTIVISANDGDSFTNHVDVLYSVWTSEASFQDAIIKERGGGQQRPTVCQRPRGVGSTFSRFRLPGPYHDSFNVTIPYSELLPDLTEPSGPSAACVPVDMFLMLKAPGQTQGKPWDDGGNPGDGGLAGGGGGGWVAWRFVSDNPAGGNDYNPPCNSTTSWFGFADFALGASVPAATVSQTTQPRASAAPVAPAPSAFASVAAASIASAPQPIASAVAVFAAAISAAPKPSAAAVAVLAAAITSAPKPSAAAIPVLAAAIAAALKPGAAAIPVLAAAISAAPKPSAAAVAVLTAAITSAPKPSAAATLRTPAPSASAPKPSAAAIPVLAAAISAAPKPGAAAIAVLAAAIASAPKPGPPSPSRVPDFPFCDCSNRAVDLSPFRLLRPVGPFAAPLPDGAPPSAGPASRYCFSLTAAAPCRPGSPCCDMPLHKLELLIRSACRKLSTWFLGATVNGLDYHAYTMQTQAGPGGPTYASLAFNRLELAFPGFKPVGGNVTSLRLCITFAAAGPGGECGSPETLCDGRGCQYALYNPREAKPQCCPNSWVRRQALFLGEEAR